MEQLFLKALRGATSLKKDTPQDMDERVEELLGELFSANNITADDIVSIIFTTTPDLTSTYPATSARNKMNLDDTAMLGASEQAVEGGVPLCVRVLIYFYTQDFSQSPKPVYLHEAAALRKDL